MKSKEMTEKKVEEFYYLNLCVCVLIDSIQFLWSLFKGNCSTIIIIIVVVIIEIITLIIMMCLMS